MTFVLNNQRCGSLDRDTHPLRVPNGTPFTPAGEGNERPLPPASKNERRFSGDAATTAKEQNLFLLLPIFCVRFSFPIRLGGSCFSCVLLLVSCLPKGVDGATTVAATSYLASLAGVKVFVTGGMGGVHRGAETTFDVSADLAELARTPIVVVCAGVKSILDIEKTLEVWSRTIVWNGVIVFRRFVFLQCFVTSCSRMMWSLSHDVAMRP